MPTKESPAEVVIVDYICDSCGVGHMTPAGFFMLSSDPPKWRHECSHCKATQTFTTQYPATVFRRAAQKGSDDE